MEFTNILIISLTSTAILNMQDPLTFGKSFRRPALSPLGTIRRHSPSFNFPVLSYESTNPQGQYPALFAWRSKLFRTTAALTMIYVESTLI